MIPCSSLTLFTDLSEEGQEEEAAEDEAGDTVSAEDEAEDEAEDTEDTADTEDADDGEPGDSGGGEEEGEEIVGRFRLGSAPTASSEPGTHSHFRSFCNK